MPFGTTQDLSAPLDRRQLRVAVAGLMLVLTVAALDQNIVGTALPEIVSDLGGLAHLSWVVTAFMLAATTTTPLYGKLSDLYGRRPMFFLAIGIFLVGSALCGIAASMTQLILYRGLQGLGAGGLISLAQITIADLVSPRERGRYQGLFTAVFAVCSIAGPLLGGFLTDALSWRWIFYVNLPVGGAALVLIALGLPRSSRRQRHHIDYQGALWMSTATICLLLMLSWGGAIYPWGSPLVLGMAAAACLLYLLLILRERVAPEPLLPLRLFGNRVVVIAVTATGLISIALMGAFIFLPTFFQLVMGASPTLSGLMTAPLMGGLIFASVLGGRFIARTGRYRWLPAIGLGLTTACFLVLAAVTRGGSGILLIDALLAILGAGIGLAMPTLTVAVQNAVDRLDIGIGTSAMSFFRSLGGALGVAAAGSIMTGGLATLPARWLAAGPSIAEIDALPPTAHAAFVAAYSQAIATTFLAAAVVSALACAVAVFLPARQLRTSLA